MRFAWIIAAALLFPSVSVADGEKKEHVGVAAAADTSTPWKYEFVIDDSSFTAPACTSYCYTENNDMLVQDGGGAPGRCYEMAGFTRTINTFTVTVNDTLGADSACSVSLAINNVIEPWSSAATGSDSTPIECDHMIETVDSDDRLEAIGDSCTNIDETGTVYEQGDTLSVCVEKTGTTCNDIQAIFVTIEGTLTLP
jgi:hypothetical protein